MSTRTEKLSNFIKEPLMLEFLLQPAGYDKISAYFNSLNIELSKDGEIVAKPGASQKEKPYVLHVNNHFVL